MTPARLRVTPLRAAVIGLGRMGMHHVRTCKDSADVELVAVLDHKPEWAVQVGADHHCLVATDLQSLVGKVDIAVIAVPTCDHMDTALPLLEAGIACLVEKPIASTQSQARAMIDAAGAAQTSLCVGHVERFNPAVSALLETLRQDDSPIQRLHARRLNAPSDRVYDVDCILDLMIHDLDLLNVLGVGEVTNITGSEQADREHASVSLTTAADVAAHLDVSRVAKQQQRDLIVDCDETVYAVDYAARTLTRRQRDTETPLTIAPRDPLSMQLMAFIDVVDGREARHIASGEDGYQALKLAERVREELGFI